MKILPKMCSPNKGFAIMLVLMMLFLLFMLGVAFFFSAWTHAFMARNYLNMKRAYVVAEGGVHHAIGNIMGDFAWMMHAENKHVNERWKYWGNLGPETPQPSLLEITKTPVEYARYPSFAMPKAIEVLGEKVGLSGVIDPGGGAYGINSDIFHLKVTECSAQLYVNEGIGHPYNTAVMRRVLNRLGEQLDLGIKLGDQIMDPQNRPPDGYKSKADLKGLLDRIDSGIYPVVKDFLCVATWSDSKVANPVPLSCDAKDAYYMDFEDKGDYPAIYRTRPGYPDRIITRYGRGRKNFPPGFERNYDRVLFHDQTANLGEAIIYGYQELNPCYIEVTRRAPVNINTAPQEILVALLLDLQGFFVIGQLRYLWNGFDSIIDLGTHRFCYPVGKSLEYPGEIGVIFRTKKIDLDLATAIARRIIEQRRQRPFRTWAEFNRFIDTLVWHLGSGLVDDGRGPRLLNTMDANPFKDYVRLYWDHYRDYASQALADTLKANFNPNLHLNEINPDASLYTWVDKTDLITNSTEFCFLPTGYFEIESVGRILRAEWEPGRFHISPYLIIPKDSFEYNNQIMGQRRLKVVAKLWDLYRQTTQGDFMRGTYSTNTHLWPTSGNWGCESGPEPINGWGPFENNYEGYVSLSTVGGALPSGQTRVKGKLYRLDDSIPVETDPSYVTMHAHYDFDFRLHKCKAGDEYRRPFTEAPVPLGTLQNWGVKDWTEDKEERDYTSPYCTAYDPERYRIARSYRWGDKVKAELISPIDHRRDGFYAERFAQLPYYSGKGNFPRPYSSNKGHLDIAVSYWIKPGFHPEFNGYVRAVSSINLDYNNIFMHLIGWATGTGKVTTETEAPALVGFGMMRPHSMRLNWTYAYPSSVVGRPVYYITPTLNHAHHDSIGPESAWPPCYGPNSLLAHRWTHVLLMVETHVAGYSTHPKEITQIYVNGRPLGDKIPFPFGRTFLPDYTIGGKNPFWLGGSRLTRKPAHCTIDEFYVTSDYEIKYVTSACRSCDCTCTQPCQCGRDSKCREKGECLWGKGQVPCWCYSIAACKGASCSARCKCKGKGEIPCWCPSTRGCKGGSGGPCPCPSSIVCKGGKGRSCWCPRYRKCKGGRWRCPWYCKCKGTGVIKDCGRWCTCKGTGVIEDCNRWCRCGGDGRMPCYCSRLAACKGGMGTRCLSYCRCEGKGWTPCLRCDGTGKQTKNREVKIDIPGLTYVEEAMIPWRKGRYYRQNDAEFISQQIDLGRAPDRLAPGPNALDDPYGNPRYQDGEKVTGSAWNHPKVKILGLSWTGYTDGLSDYSEPDMPGLLAQLEVTLEARGKDGGWVQIAGPFLNLDAGWAPVFVRLSCKYPQIRYRVRFNTRCNPASAILIASPIFDDITIYYSTCPQFLSWEESY